MKDVQKEDELISWAKICISNFKNAGKIYAKIKCLETGLTCENCPIEDFTKEMGLYDKAGDTLDFCELLEKLSLVL